jgi:hypothetical protein
MSPKAMRRGGDVDDDPVLRGTRARGRAIAESMGASKPAGLEAAPTITPEEISKARAQLAGADTAPLQPTGRSASAPRATGRP